MKISAIDPASVVRMVPMRPIQMRLFPQDQKHANLLKALETLLAVKPSSVDITAQSIGTAVIITGAKLPAK